jgi:hypothetical protein
VATFSGSSPGCPGAQTSIAATTLPTERDLADHSDSPAPCGVRGGEFAKGGDRGRGTRPVQGVPLQNQYLRAVSDGLAQGTGGLRADGDDRGVTGGQALEQKGCGDPGQRIGRVVQQRIAPEPWRRSNAGLVAATDVSEVSVVAVPARGFGASHLIACHVAPHGSGSTPSR